MSQYDFGTIDPYVDDGVTLADMLNNWRDAVHSWHRGAGRPSYAQPGMLWINDAGGPTNWLVYAYLGPAAGDILLWAYDTTTGAFTFGNPAQVASAILLAQAAASPSVRWNATGNSADAKAWRATVQGDGRLRFGAYNDAGAELGAITFDRTGRLHAVAPPAGDDSDTVATTAWVKANSSSSSVTAPTFDTSSTPQTDAGGWTGGTVLQITQGTQVFTRSFAAVDASHPIEVDCGLTFGAGGVGVQAVFGLFIDGAAAAVAQQNCTVNTQWFFPARLFWRGVLAAGAHIFSIRFMGGSGIYLLRNDATFMSSNTYNYLKISEVGVGPVGPPGPPGVGNYLLKEQSVELTLPLQASALVIPLDNTIPQITEGLQCLALNYLPVAGATSRIRASASLSGYIDGSGGTLVASLFKDAGPNAVRAGCTYSPGTNQVQALLIEHSSRRARRRQFRSRCASALIAAAPRHG